MPHSGPSKSCSCARVLALPLIGVLSACHGTTEVGFRIHSIVARDKIVLKVDVSGPRPGKMGVEIAGHPAFSQLGCRELKYYHHWGNPDSPIGSTQFEIPTNSLEPGKRELLVRTCKSRSHQGQISYLFDYQGVPPELEFQRVAHEGDPIRIQDRPELKLPEMLYADPSGMVTVETRKGGGNRVEVNGQVFTLSPGSRVSFSMVDLLAGMEVPLSFDQPPRFLSVPFKITDRYGIVWTKAIGLRLTDVVKAVFQAVGNGPVRRPNEAAHPSTGRSMILIGDSSDTVSFGGSFAFKDVDLIAIETSHQVDRRTCEYTVSSRRGISLNFSRDFAVTWFAYDSEISVYDRRKGKLLGTRRFPPSRALACGDVRRELSHDEFLYLEPDQVIDNLKKKDFSNTKVGPGSAEVEAWLAKYLAAGPSRR